MEYAVQDVFRGNDAGKIAGARSPSTDYEGNLPAVAETGERPTCGINKAVRLLHDRAEILRLVLDAFHPEFCREARRLNVKKRIMRNRKPVTVAGETEGLADFARSKTHFAQGHTLIGCDQVGEASVARHQPIKPASGDTEAGVLTVTLIAAEIALTP